MKLGNGRRTIVAAMVIIAIAAIGQPVHAQQITERTSNASYAPGDSGSLVVTVVNDQPDPLTIRNITVYFPWATVIDGAWPTGANVSENLSPAKTLGSQSNNNTWSYTAQFTIPTWYGGGAFGPCPGDTALRYGEYSGCVLLGASSSARYQTDSFEILMARPVYIPQTLASQWLPIATFAVLVVATAFLAMAWNSLRRLPRK